VDPRPAGLALLRYRWKVAPAFRRQPLGNVVTLLPQSQGCQSTARRRTDVLRRKEISSCEVVRLNRMSGMYRVLSIFVSNAALSFLIVSALISGRISVATFLACCKLDSSAAKRDHSTVNLSRRSRPANGQSLLLVRKRIFGDGKLIESFCALSSNTEAVGFSTASCCSRRAVSCCNS